ncbi:hypothetical protein [Sphaerisporangium rhizosphaerae]|uniref:RHS repeat protein n=1 Tax=Sphaerisporangium rhizosphaerae TaxID=2269375 RepID=A0ABW2PE08_9ACTN
MLAEWRRQDREIVAGRQVGNAGDHPNSACSSSFGRYRLFAGCYGNPCNAQGALGDTKGSLSLVYSLGAIMTFIPQPGCRTNITQPSTLPGDPTVVRWTNDDGTYRQLTYDGGGRLVRVQEGGVSEGSGSTIDQYTLRNIDPVTCGTISTGSGSWIRTAVPGGVDSLERREITTDRSGLVTTSQYSQKEKTDSDGRYHIIGDKTVTTIDDVGKVVTDRYEDDRAMLSGGLIEGESLLEVREHFVNGKMTDRSASFTDKPDNPGQGNQSTTAVEYHSDGGATIQTISREPGRQPDVKTTRVDKDGNPLESPLPDDDDRPRPAQPNPLALGDDDQIEPSAEFEDRANSFTAPEEVVKQSTAPGSGWPTSARAGRQALSHEEIVARAFEGLYPDR